MSADTERSSAIVEMLRWTALMLQTPECRHILMCSDMSAACMQKSHESLHTVCSDDKLTD